MNDASNFSRFIVSSSDVAERIAAIQTQHPEIPWYPYFSMANLDHLLPLVGPIDHLFSGNHRVADIGAADGHLAFCFEAIGNTCDIYDYGPTNYNGLRGARLLKEELPSAVQIYERDLDSQFELQGEYDLILFLGILYHLKNPYLALERLAKHSRHLIISTRVCRHFIAGGQDVSDISAAYLLGPDESNNDATNYWIFTTVGLLRLFKRTGWDVIAAKHLGDVETSNPQDNARDERVIAVLARR